MTSDSAHVGESVRSATGNTVDNQTETLFTKDMNITIKPYTYKDVPSADDKAEAVAALLNTNIPYGYRAAVSLMHQYQHNGSKRPSNARMAWQHHAGTVNGYENAVKDLFGFFFHGDAKVVLEQAVAALDAKAVPT